MPAATEATSTAVLHAHHEVVAWGSFVGREDELARLRATIPTTHILTLVGPGGVGKSRLAMRAASGLHAQFPDGIHVFDASAQVTAGNVVQRVSDLLDGYRVIHRDSGEPLTETLASRRLLLILDNCDAVVAECARLAADLLRTCRGVRIVATGRGPLHIAGSGFSLNAETMRPLAHICRRLDGLPLALEIIAMHVVGVGLDRIAARLDRPYALELSGNPDAPPRHRSLRNAVHWSYGLLNAPERLLFARLATFVGGWTLEAAERVCSDERLPRASVAALLDSMVGTSLLVLAEQGPSVRFRFAGWFASTRPTCCGRAVRRNSSAAATQPI